MLDVCLLGTGGMMPLPYRYLTSLMLRYNGVQLLVDCGEATQIAMKEAKWSAKPIDVMCITHYHADHISGLPGMLLTMGNADRTEPLTMVGPKGLERVVNSLRVIAPELPFPIKFIELNENIEQLSLAGIDITAFRLQHKVTCYGYKFEIKRGGRFDPQRAKEQEIPLPLWHRLQKGETIEDPAQPGKIYTPDMVLGPARRGLKLVYATDTRPVPVIAEQAQDADLFICEGMYGDPEKVAKAKENKHMMLTEAAQLAKQAQPRRFWLTHYSPSLNHPEEYEKDVRKIFPEAVLPKDGRSITLSFDEE